MSSHGGAARPGEAGGGVSFMLYSVYADLSRPLTEKERAILFDALDAAVPGSGCVGRWREPNDEIYFCVEASSDSEAREAAVHYLRGIFAVANVEAEYTIEVVLTRS